jgi:hypothetical protein
LEEIVGKNAGLGKAMTALANLKVDPPITITTLKVVLFNEFHRDVSSFNADLFGVWHWSIEVEVLEVDGAEMCTWAREHAVEKKLDKFEGCGVGSHFAREADVIAANHYVSAIRIIFSGCTSHAIAANHYASAIRIIFSGRTLHTTMVWQISFHLWHGMLW